MNPVRDNELKMFDGCQWRPVSNGVKILRYCSILLLLTVLLSGCTEKQAGEKTREKVKLADLIPKDSSGSKENSTVGLYVYVYQIDRDNYPSVQQELSQAADLPVEYEDSKSFSSNGLIGGGGDINTWAKLAQVLTDAQAAIIKRTITYISDNTDDDILITELTEPGSVRCYSGGDTSAGMGLPAGTVWLRINSKPLIGLKQSRRINIMPIYKAEAISNDKNPKNPTWEFPFSSTSLKVPLRPGQFVFIAPDAANFPQEGLPLIGKMIFCADKPKPVVRFCLVACSLIND
jgi:hypothetical protein